MMSDELREERSAERAEAEMDMMILLSFVSRVWYRV
jgi:hypothetical protein